MSDVVLAALIGAGASIIVQLIATRHQNVKRAAEEAEKEKARAVAEALKEERLAARLGTIERTLEENNRKLDIHNGYAEKLGSIQTDIAVIRNDIKTLYKKGDLS